MCKEHFITLKKASLEINKREALFVYHFVYLRKWNFIFDLTVSIFRVDWLYRWI